MVKKGQIKKQGAKLNLFRVHPLDKYLFSPGSKLTYSFFCGRNFFGRGQTFFVREGQNFFLLFLLFRSYIKYAQNSIMVLLKFHSLPIKTLYCSQIFMMLK